MAALVEERLDALVEPAGEESGKQGQHANLWGERVIEKEVGGELTRRRCRPGWTRRAHRRRSGQSTGRQWGKQSSARRRGRARAERSRRGDESGRWGERGGRGTGADQRSSYRRTLRQIGRTMMCKGVRVVGEGEKGWSSWRAEARSTQVPKSGQLAAAAHSSLARSCSLLQGIR